MKARHKRMGFILVGVAGLAVVAALVLNALNSNMSLYISPTDVLAGKAAKAKDFRLGGLVVKGSLKRQSDGLTVHFNVTDMANTIPVSFTGILPDLFTEGSGVVAQGRMNAKGMFVATQVLAKHDEKYMPPEVAAMLKKGKKLKKEEATAQKEAVSTSMSTTPSTPTPASTQ
jgi:cytochrome c-type biogenesis protein CcmE